MPSQYRLTVKNQLTELRRIHVCIDSFCKQHQLPAELVDEMLLITEELVVNTINYGYEDGDEHTIDIEINLDEQSLTIALTDDAKAFNPLQQQAPLLGQPAKDTLIGGLGIPLIRALSDRQHYQRHKHKNVFIFTKLLLTDP